MVATHQIDDIDTTYDSVAVVTDGMVSFTGSVGDYLDLDPSGKRDPYWAYERATGEMEIAR